MMMERLGVRLVALLVLTFPAIVFADVIVEPENDFYQKHQSRILVLGRRFVANGEDGSVSVQNAPGSSGSAAKIENGETAFMKYSCRYDGAFWGFTTERSGWVKLDQMLVLYDYVAFEEEHKDEIYRYSGDYAAIKETNAAIAWPWPGCGTPLWIIRDVNSDSLRVVHAYRDEGGREWGFVRYIFGSKNIWVCLSDPLNRAIPAFNPAPEPVRWVSETPHTEIPRSDNTVLMLITVLVAVLVVGTAVLIRVCWKREPTKPGSERSE